MAFNVLHFYALLRFLLNDDGHCQGYHETEMVYFFNSILKVVP